MKRVVFLLIALTLALGPTYAFATYQFFCRVGCTGDGDDNLEDLDGNGAVGPPAYEALADGDVGFVITTGLDVCIYVLDADANQATSTESPCPQYIRPLSNYGTKSWVLADMNATAFSSIATATPTVAYKDSGATAGDVNCRSYVNCTDEDDGEEDCDWTLECQVDGVPTNKIVADADGNVTITSLAATNAVLTTPNIGTPSAGTLTNCTGLPISSGVSGLGSNVATFLATPSGANLASALTSALPVTDGGTGATTLTEGGILIGGGTGAVTALGVASNGQIPIGDGTTAPQLANITGTANEIEITNGAASIQVGIPDSPTLTTPNIGAATGTSLALTGMLTGLIPSITITTAEGVHDGDANAATLSDSGESWPTDEYIGMTLYNTTDGSSCVVTDNDGTTMTCTLSGGTDNDWDVDDVWAVAPGPSQSGSIIYIGSATTILHPATAGYAAIYYSTAANTIKVDPQSSSMQFTLDGTPTGTNGEELDSEGNAGDFIAIHNASATVGRTLGRSGTWTDGESS